MMQDKATVTDDRRHRCYELALEALIDAPAAAGWHLAHGRIAGEPGDVVATIGHAWLVNRDGSSVYDPVLDRSMPMGEYLALVGSIAEDATYSRIEAATMALVSNTFGPWTAPKGARLSLKLR